MRRKLKIAGLVSSTVLVALVVTSSVLYYAIHRAPAFYQQALVVDPIVQRQASDELLETATALSNGVRKTGSWYALFTEEQINGWLAVDLVQNHANWLPEGFADPRVEIRQGRATLACAYRSGVLSTVMSMRVELYMVDETSLAMRLEGARAGSIPVPMKTVVDGLSQAAEVLNLRVHWRQSSGDPVAIIALPAAHDARSVYRLEALELRDGAVYLAGRTEPLSSDGSPSDSLPVEPAVAERWERNVKVQR